MKKRCLLISPPGELFIFPRGIMEIATFLNRRGFPTTVLPLGFYFKKDYPVDESGFIKGNIDQMEVYHILIDTIRSVDPMVIGVSNCYTKDFHNCVDIIKMCKEIDARIITVMGGSHATFCDVESIQTAPGLDIVVRGEGEWVMLNLLRAIYEKRDYQAVKGITIGENGKIRRNEDEIHGSLAEIPPVDFGLLPADFVKMSYIHGILHRGCAYHCKYCIEEKFWGKPRPYRIEKVIQEMEMLQKSYQTQFTGLEESMLGMHSKKFFQFFQSIRENDIRLPTDFYITTRIDTVTDEGIDTMRQTGISRTCVGIESFSQKVLREMNKSLSFESVHSGCEKLMRNNIWLTGYWLIGHPGDDAHEADHTYGQFKSFLEKGLLKSGYAFIFVPYPGTEFFYDPGKYGIRIFSYDWSRWRRWTSEPVSCLENFSSSEIVAAYDKATDLLSTYKKLNQYLASNRERVNFHS
ncbi:MAG: B12-binding domain-containing radical SAM protein [Deltaproteobacteria bacterium]|nr:B12-binding domain-containing radical SAM protein [Deltaproteobacteria bacterium]